MTLVRLRQSNKLGFCYCDRRHQLTTGFQLVRFLRLSMRMDVVRAC